MLTTIIHVLMGISLGLTMANFVVISQYMNAVIDDSIHRMEITKALSRMLIIFGVILTVVVVIQAIFNITGA